MIDIVEAMARAAHDAEPQGFSTWAALVRASAEGSTFAASIMEMRRNQIRAAIRAVTDAGGLVLREVPGEAYGGGDMSAGFNVCLDAVRALAVEGV